MKISVVCTYLFVVMTSLSCAQEHKNQAKVQENQDFIVEMHVDDLINPWGMVFLPNGGLLISEKSGKLLLFKDGKKVDIGNLPEIYVRGQGGFLDLELHPDYANNGWLYFSFASSEGDGKGGNTAIMRAKLKNNSLVEKQLLYKATPNTTKVQHFGSRLEFDNEGYLYFSVGDRGNRDVNPQDITRDGGKIYRILDDGSIPKDNPFVHEKNAKKAIFSYGHRNPQGLVKHPETGAIWDHEHGPRGGDEINILKKGKNYGWPIVTYGINYSGTPITNKTSLAGMEQPLHYWVKYPNWKGNLLVGSLSFQYLERLILENNKVVYREKLLENMGRVRNVRQGPDGYIYVAIERKGIYKLVPKA